MHGQAVRYRVQECPSGKTQEGKRVHHQWPKCLWRHTAKSCAWVVSGMVVECLSHGGEGWCHVHGGQTRKQTKDDQQ